MAIEVDEPEVVRVRLEAEDGVCAGEVLFTRAEYEEIRVRAAADGKTVERYIIDAALARCDISPLLADRRGSG